MLLDRIFPPKPKKKNYALPIALTSLALVILCPVKVKLDRQNKKWSVGSLTYNIEKDEDDVTFTFPGPGFDMLKKLFCKLFAVVSALFSALFGKDDDDCIDDEAALEYDEIDTTDDGDAAVDETENN